MDKSSCHNEYVTKCKKLKVQFPAQCQSEQPGKEYLMDPKPIFDRDDYIGSCKLKGKVAIITGGDSGIGRSVAVLYAKEGAKVVVAYYNEHEDAKFTKHYIEQLGGECLLIAGDIKDPAFSKEIVDKTLQRFCRIDIVVNNAGVQFVKDSILDISDEQLALTFHTNIFGMFYLVKAALPHLQEGSCIINTTSITTYNGFSNLIDYVSTKGAIVGFTRALAHNLVDKKIRVNAVAPGYIWTPLQPASQPIEDIPIFGSDSQMKRAGQPIELAPTYVYLASKDSGYVSGQVLHVDGSDSTSS